MDPELEALSEITRQLGALEPAERRRVLQYINQRFGHPLDQGAGTGAFAK